MTDRLQNLLRQRALLQEHLAWLNDEISEAEGIPSLPNTTARPAQTIGPAAPSVVTSSDEAEKILGQFQKEAGDMKTDTRRGCLMIFSITMGIFALAVFVGYYFYTRHLGRWW
jgi:hypothetical protein